MGLEESAGRVSVGVGVGAGEGDDDWTPRGSTGVWVDAGARAEGSRTAGMVGVVEGGEEEAEVVQGEAAEITFVSCFTSSSSSSPHPSSSASFFTPDWHSPRCFTSRTLFAWLKTNPVEIDGNMRSVKSEVPTSSKFIKRRGVEGDTFFIKEAKGCTSREVPITSNKSHTGKSFALRSKNLGGRLSPKNTISGFTRPLHDWHLGTLSEKTLSLTKSHECSILQSIQ
jgi:hypothetical protein